MHPRNLLNACTDLLRLCLAFEHPADMVVSRYFREQRGLGARERRVLPDAVYAVLRRKLLYEHFAAMVPGERPDQHRRRLAVLGQIEEHTSELQSPLNLVCRLLLE